jgi:TRAP-type transport system periplasmic protein
MRRVVIAFAAAAAMLAVSQGPASAQEVTLRIHQFLPAQAPIPANFIAPWAEKVTEESDGRIQFELYPAMQLGGAPPALYDQAREGVADIVWTVLGYTPGRFPKMEVFDLPFIATNGEQTSRAAWEYYMEHAQEEFADVHVIAVHTHGPGLIHARGEGVRALEDLEGLNVRGPTRMITRLLERLGATAVGMPVPQVPESLSRGVIDGAVIPWEVTAPLRVAELVETHTGFSGDRSLYVTPFVFAMNQQAYDNLPDDLKAVIDANSGIETSAWAGRVMDEGDDPGREIAEERGNDIVILDEAETERWREAAQVVIDEWVAEMDEAGQDGEALVEAARELVTAHSGGS